MKRKLTSRKFWLSAAAFLGSIATSVSGFALNNEKIIIAGSVCGMISAAIYSALEASIDLKAKEGGKDA